MTEDNAGSSDPLDRLHLTVDSHVVVQLGAELVSDVEQALLELVKNAYDADSPFCNVEIDTQYIEDAPESNPEPNGDDDSLGKKADVEPPPRLKGRIRVIDAGDGMTLEQIQKGWLVISASLKRPSQKGRKEPTKKYRRIPLGDKGLGRLSTMRLGDRLTIQTFTESESEGIEVSFRWSDFVTGVPIEGVALQKKHVPKRNRVKGTTIEIVGLADLDIWQQSGRRHSLRENLSGLISPFDNFDNFSISLAYDGASDVAEKLSSEQLMRSSAEFAGSWSSKLPSDSANCEVGEPFLELSSLIRLSLFAGNNKKTNDLYARYIDQDKGLELVKYFASHRETRALALVRSPADGALSYKETIRASDIPADRAYAFWRDPGPFDAKIYYYMLTQDLDAVAAAGERSVISKSTVKAMAGVSIFRDGFKVRFGDDWLRLSHNTTSGGSFYGLRPQNTLGYFNITGQGNSQLVEKSDREGFIDNPEFRGFMIIARRMAKFSNDVLERLRRATNDFLRESESTNTSGNSLSPEEGLQKIQQANERLSATRARFDSLAQATTARFNEIKTKTRAAKNDLLVDIKVQSLLTEIEGQLEGFANDLQVARQEIQRSSEQISREMLVVNEVGARFEALHEQIARLYESAAVGLSARGLVHDASVFLDDIFAAVKAVRASLASDFRDEGQIQDKLGAIQSAARGVANYLALIDPMLPAHRIRREIVQIADFVESYFRVREAQFSAGNIEIVLISKDLAPTVRINKGRLLQIVDNLARNSQYWVKVAARDAGDTKSIIYVEFDNGGFRFWDSGNGIRRELETTLFDLFVTDKPDGEGGGMGLFIAKTLLDIDGCKIALGSDRNSLGRRFKFFVDLSNVRIEK